MTSFDLPSAIFYDMVEKDADFFNYYSLPPNQARDLAEQRADAFLAESAMELSLAYETDFDFADFDRFKRCFNGDLTNEEIYLLASLQYEKYLSRDIASLHARAVRFTSAEQNLFSPAQERTSFINMYKRVQDANRILIDSYLSKDRLTGVRKTLTYTEDE